MKFKVYFTLRNQRIICKAVFLNMHTLFNYIDRAGKKIREAEINRLYGDITIVVETYLDGEDVKDDIFLIRHKVDLTRFFLFESDRFEHEIRFYIQLFIKNLEFSLT